MSTSSRRRASSSSKWQPPPPPPTPKILHLPRHIRLLSRHPKPPPPAAAARNLRCLFKEEILNHHPQCGSNAALPKPEKTQEIRKKIDGSDIIEKKMGKLKLRSSEVNGSVAPNIAKQDIKVEMLKRKMEGLSKGMKDRMEEYGSFFSSANSKQKRRDIANQQQQKEAGEMEYRCCCNCKEVVGRIAEEVKAETEQWTDMQEMLDQVRQEMEELRSSRDLWQRRAVASELNIPSLYSQIAEWKRKAQESEQKVAELQKEILQHERFSGSVIAGHVSAPRNGNPDDWNLLMLPKIKCQQLRQRSSDYSAAAEEKQVLVCRLKNNNKSSFSRRLPLRDIGNLS